MARGLFEFADVKKPEACPPKFIRSFQTALLLSMLDKGLLTRQQFERCVEELQKQFV